MSGTGTGNRAVTLGVEKNDVFAGVDKTQLRINSKAAAAPIDTQTHLIVAQ
jgi:hypothetical protein